MGALLRIVSTHLRALADELIPQIIAHYERAIAPQQTFASVPKPLPELDPYLKEKFLLLSHDISPHLAHAYRTRGYQVLKQFKIGAETNHVVDHRALKYASMRGSDLIVDITNSTKDMVRGKLTSAIEEGWSARTLADNLRDDFSPVRALRIARTEMEMAYRASGLEAAKIAEAQIKRWNAAVDACPLCQENAEQGSIKLDDSFVNGDNPHPNCACDIDYSLGSPTEEAVTD